MQQQQIESQRFQQTRSIHQITELISQDFGTHLLIETKTHWSKNIYYWNGQDWQKIMRQDLHELITKKYFFIDVKEIPQIITNLSHFQNLKDIKFDVNSCLLNFENGVFDLKQKSIRQRKDIDFCLNKFKYQYEKNSQYIVELNNYLESLFDFSTKEILLDMLSHFFNPPKENTVVVFSGKYSSGKSQLLNLICLTFNGIKLCPSVFEVKDKDRFRENKLIVISNESATVTWSIKEHIRNNLVFLDNNPGQNKYDYFIYLPNSFVQNPTNPNEKLQDMMLEEKMKKWCSSLMYIVIQRYLLKNSSRI